MNGNGYAPDSMIAGRYRVVRKIGAGGMGQVYEVTDTALEGENLALKVISPSDSEESSLADIQRFRNEVQITRKLTHPNIVRTFDFGVLDDGRCYMTMEMVNGATLENLIKNGRLTAANFSAIVTIVAAIARAVDHAHSLGVIHRDLKAANILLTEEGRVKVTDFGLARMRGLDQKITCTGECIGTPSYMSPEQVQGQALDFRTDIYSLGIIAYELAAGRVPFEDRSWYGLVTKIVHHPLPELNESIPPWFRTIIVRATAKQKEDRFQSASEIAKTLTNSGKGLKSPLRGATDGALPPVYVAAPPVSRTNAAMIALICCLLIALGAAGMSVISKSIEHPPPVIQPQQEHQAMQHRDAEPLRWLPRPLPHAPTMRDGRPYRDREELSNHAETIERFGNTELLEDPRPPENYRPARRPFAILNERTDQHFPRRHPLAPEERRRHGLDSAPNGPPPRAPQS